MPTTTAPRLRERFPTLANATYLVSHSMGAPPLGARDALRAYWDAWAENGPEAWDRWLPEITEIADGLGSIFGAPPGSVSLVPNVSLAQAAIASARSFAAPRCNVVIEATQFPTVTYVWKAWERYGARVVEVPSDDGRTMSTDRICSAIDERTAVVALSHAAYVSGATIDVAAIAARCRETGALFVLDAYQTTGIVPFDAVALGVDVVVGGSHKWLCGGAGCGFVYVRPGLRAQLEPAITGWMGHAEPFAFEAAPIRLAEGAHRFNTGTPTVPGYLAARAGHDATRELGVEAIHAHNVRLTPVLADGALARGFDVPTPLDPQRRTGWIGMDFAGADRAAAALFERRIFVDYRPGCGLRVSPHFYTSDDDVDAFFTAVDEIRRATA
ncbi:MAG: aminotransferase class V-fold PLP-dependent enzyme [Candidatus Eremiobacteraeota bacterium]|nr:aminotransferase class V-fold PLP-dependent enzyme [Candidatus Eremiobacteraeota bacterium]